ncbi:methylenetetrahydrofolate--tRNA-(uracil(54)-C(5))-methyltransferase (FADH(2)-oxidizing) TrmFO [Spiroplasma chrysopicola]|uniref:Methylenetetrahydrofolate--tRNA-(uracil-5-)-methyltransferase TrmFO n=1 Tax=Spiroplasma chrysopicola DF-1 TaxID=1276227 RepID=R4UFK3_9MOLU|nr:methylenetetrahydrofolate--tRNA-(uracil(54)-C(5))-methyltransferase (FADH(2)-oxidizing) TrmFO [Spiroplasma chrysopicola]AGM24940.1 tRNA (uracil-5-)-methyltransferase Gid [Spiroplasma chrysopicola DF-1]
MKKPEINIIGAGLAGTEAAYQLAKRGYFVNLYEVKTKQKNPVQKQDTFAELVCSNSLRSNSITTGVGLLKAEMAQLDSLIIKNALANQVPAGDALAVDRDQFSNAITTYLRNHPNIKVIDEEVITIDLTKITIVATGPLTTSKMQTALQDLIGANYFYFFDAAAPIVTKDSIDLTKVYFKSRYDKGDSADYLNCPMTKEQYEHWVNELINAETVELKSFEKEIYFEGCMPIEVMAKRSIHAPLFGPLKPVGLGQKEGERPYAVVQLRQDNAVGTLYNLVGFQTNLKFPEQKRIIQLIPGLEQANIVRYGVIHKNNYINTPLLLNERLQLRNHPNVFFAGQITGVEGYVESSACGIVTALNVVNYLEKQPAVVFPKKTMIGALINYILHADRDNFQPMKANFGIIPPLIDQKFTSKLEKYQAYVKRAQDFLTDFLATNKIN